MALGGITCSKGVRPRRQANPAVPDLLRRLLVVRLVKQMPFHAGLDAAGFSGHSLRAGLATAAGDARAGLPELG